MIHTPRKDHGANLKQPSEVWFRRADAARRDAIRNKGNKPARRSIYAHDEVRINLEALFNGKCAYCEVRLTRFDWDVEHYRPKGAVHKRPDHPGYYWLAYEWRNLLPSCTFCNQRRKSRPRRGYVNDVTSFGKGTQFPVAKERTRAMNPDDDVTREKPILINPCESDPKRYFGYRVDGRIFPIKRNIRARRTIEILHLFESRLREDRKRKIDLMVDFLRIRTGVTRKGDKESVAVVNSMIEKLSSSKAEFAGAVRYVLNHPEEFGL